MKVHGPKKCHTRYPNSEGLVNSADPLSVGSAFLFGNGKNSGGEKMRRLNRKGQSTLEYVIIWTAIVAAILLAANQFLRPAIEGAVQDTSNKITTEVGNLTGGIGN